MQLDTVVTGTTLLTALLLLFVTYLVILPYFVKPEEFFIERLRPEDHHGVSHRQLLFRAFGGAGLVSAGLQSLAFCLAFSLVQDVYWVWVWPAMTLGGSLVLGVGHYIGFRCFRYRRLAPHERRPTMDGGAVLFVRRRVQGKEAS